MAPGAPDLWTEWALGGLHNLRRRVTVPHFGNLQFRAEVDLSAALQRVPPNGLVRGESLAPLRPKWSRFQVFLDGSRERSGN